MTVTKSCLFYILVGVILKYQFIRIAYLGQRINQKILKYNDNLKFIHSPKCLESGGDIYTAKAKQKILNLNFDVVGNINSTGYLTLSKLECNENKVDGGFLIQDKIYQNIELRVENDPGNDDKTGLAEVIYMMQCVSGLKPCSDFQLNEIIDNLKLLPGLNPYNSKLYEQKKKPNNSGPIVGLFCTNNH